MQYEQFPELPEATALLEARPAKPMCVAPFVFLFIGYDGNYYLCCSDWVKETPLGTVFEKSFVDVLGEKARLITTREKVCRTCNHDPANEVTDFLRANKAGTLSQEELKAKIDHLDDVWNLFVVPQLEQLSPGCTEVTRSAASKGRRLIPVQSD
jgi:hypothetical protein